MILIGGPAVKDPKTWLYVIGGVMANLSAIIAIKNEVIEQRISSLSTRVKDLDEIISNKTEQLENIKQEIKAHQQEVIRIHGIEIQHTAHYLRLKD